MKKYIIAMFILCYTMNSFSQNDTKLKGNLWSDVKKDGVKVWGGIKHAYTQPLKWKKKDWLTFGGIAAGTAIIYMYDEETSEYFIEQEPNAPHMLKEIGWYYGSPQNFFMITAGIYSYGLFARNEAWRDAGILIVSSAVATGFIQTITKNAFGRARPGAGVGSDKFKPFSSEGMYHSFPSGHTMLSMTASHAIAKQFDNIWVKSGIYAVGLIAPISRLWEGAHWLTDVVLGGVISIVVVDGIDKFFHKNDMYLHKKEKKVSWNLKAGLGTVGIVGTF
ncbi:Membrane-associated phospholipid phosphatase [Lutibacter oricola]|uniref:Membrane-associated phospholipid phosphatase n=1 Tax=Lutibacter oricola TaxID=762486 RepID=A0A1H2WCP7_9FLAO|nr:phosphatase PAP2 family protein [Lutibacter oricola]SDW78307.1 Membrane-associated phospholipid phosphatase [Lutibacter oricola]